MFILILLQHISITILFLGVFAILPGKIIAYIFKLKQWLDLNLILGVSLLTLILFFGRWVLPVSIILTIYLFFLFILLLKVKPPFKFPQFQPSKYDLLLGIFIIFGVAVQSRDYVLSSFKGTDVIKQQVYQSHDQSWHAVLVNELVDRYPPMVPGFDGVKLKNYHFFYDLLIAAQVEAMGGDPLIYIQLIYPVLISLLYGVSIWRITSVITRNHLIQLSVPLFAYLGNNLAYVFNWLGAKQWLSDTLLLDQPIIYLPNQQTVLSIAFFLYGLYIWDVWYQKGLKIKGIWPLVMVTAALMNLKIYGFIILGLTIGFLSFMQLLKLFFTNRQAFFKTAKSLMVFAIALIGLCGCIYFLTFNPGTAFIVFNPGWILDQFFLRNILPISTYLASRRALYQYYQQSVKLLTLDVLIAIIYVLANLNIRLLGLMANFKSSKLGQGLLISSFFSLALIFIGNQVYSAFNIIQFGPYAVVAMTILMVWSLDRIQNPKLLFTLILLLMLCSFPTSIKTLTQTHANYEINEEKKLSINCFEQLQSAPKGRVLLLDSDYRINNSIGVFAKQPAYYIDQTQLEVLGVDYPKRKAMVQNINNNFCQLDINVIKAENIRYIIDKSNSSCEPTKVIYNNSGCKIFKFY